MLRRALLLAPLSAIAQNRPQEATFHRKPSAKIPAAGSDWPSFLGPSHNGNSPEKGLAAKFGNSGPPLIWEFRKGTGYASPAIAKERLVFLHRVGGSEFVECMHPATGKRLWQFSYPTNFEDRYGYNNGPRSSPVIAGDLVYTVGAQAQLHCLRLESGAVVWKRDLIKEFGLRQDFFGVSSTPLVLGDSLIANIGAPSGPSVVAFNRLTGKQLWSAKHEWGASYASPIPATVHGVTKVYVFAGAESRPPTGGLMLLDPSTGEIHDTFPWRSKSYESVNASCPVAFDNKVFISASYNTGGALLDVGKDWKFKLAWTTREFGLHFNTPIHEDGHLYGYDGRNEPDASLVCLDTRTGKVVWRETAEWDEAIPTSDGGSRRQLMSTYRGNLLRVDGRFLALGEFGHLLWLNLSPSGYKQTSRAWLFAARETWSLPVLSHGLLYVVQHSRDILHNKEPRLLCYDLRS